MSLKFISSLFLLPVIFVFVNCGHDQQLTSITISPSTETFGAANIPVSANAGSSVQLRALGTFIHPPVTKDITSSVVWASNDVQIATVNSTGVLSATGFACGSGLVSATVPTNHSIGNLNSNGAIVTGSMNVVVVCFTGSGSGGSPLLTVTFPGMGAGTVSSMPVGLICSITCSDSFTSGTQVTLTASPTAPSTFGGWTGCDSVSGGGLICSINSLTASKNVSALFN